MSPSLESESEQREKTRRKKKRRKRKRRRMGCVEEEEETGSRRVSAKKAKDEHGKFLKYEQYPFRLQQRAPEAYMTQPTQRCSET